ncbi:zinc finger protein BRUTUS-like At1g18910 isoform X2 [Silene latifolia]
MCSFPVMLLEDVFPWLASLLPPEERLDLKDCMSNILAQDKSALLETVIFWINKADKKSQENCHKDDRISECSQDQDNLRDVSTLCLLKNNPFDCLLRWQAAIKSDLEEILNKLDQARVQEFPSLSSVIVKIKFLNEVLIFHSDILENILYPLVEKSSLHQTSPLYTSVPLKNEVVGLQNVLYDANKIHEPTFLESLCSQMESLVLLTTEHLSFQETEIFPLISEKCKHKSQLEVLIKSLHTLPLGLLKCVVTWFSSHLPKDELKFILHGIGQSCLLDKPFALLLHEWAHAGYSGKSSTENLEEIFSRRVPFMSELIRDDNDPGKNIKQESLSSACCSRTPFLQSVSSSSGPPSKTVSCNILEPRPMDHIYYFHKAIKKDLESLVLDAAKLSKDSKLLLEFTQHFCSVRSLYELHSETEDKIAFPALEANLNARNITQSYSMDHEMEAQHFERVSGIIDKMSGVYVTVSWSEYCRLCLELEDSCKSLKKILEDHILREETEIWPLFREYFSIEEQETILGYMLGRTRADILQKMIVWLMAHLSLDEQQTMMNYWQRATYFTKFNEWLGEWWENVNKYNFGEAGETTTEYLSIDVSRDLKQDINVVLRNNDYNAAKRAKKMEGPHVVKQRHESFEYVDVQRNQLSKPALEVHDKHLVASQLDQEAKPHLDSDDVITTDSGKLHGQFPSYRDSEASVFGCKHYKQNCKLVASCCNQIFTCRRCHDEEIYHDDGIYDHVMDRKSTTQMMCMRCLEIQPIGRACSTPSCNEYSMARYYCKICKLFDDEREIYHCPYCNLCRVGKGLGIDYYHCMKCNACMSRFRPLHVCIERSIEDKCSICQEEMFTSTNPLKSLPCGHAMHSTCFEDYIWTRYTCPICSKSLGDMQVYTKMLDAYMAKEKMPEEYAGKTQAILCNDCEKKGTAPFHWAHHKCSYCGSYNTRRL